MKVVRQYAEDKGENDIDAMLDEMDFKGWLYALTQHLDEDEEGGNDSEGAEEEAKASDG